RDFHVTGVQTCALPIFLKEDGPRPGIDDFSRFRSEALHTTPGLITRAVRSAAYRKTMTVSAAKTEIPPGQTLSYHWTVLRGDPRSEARRVGTESRPRRS